VIFLAVVAYAASLLTMGAHEVLGHGGAALLLGGELRRGDGGGVLRLVWADDAHQLGHSRSVPRAGAVFLCGDGGPDAD